MWARARRDFLSACNREVGGGTKISRGKWEKRRERGGKNPFRRRRRTTFLRPCKRRAARQLLAAAAADAAVIGAIFSGAASGQIKQKFPFVTKARENRRAAAQRSPVCDRSELIVPPEDSGLSVTAQRRFANAEIVFSLRA